MAGDDPRTHYRLPGGATAWALDRFVVQHVETLTTGSGDSTLTYYVADVPLADAMVDILRVAAAVRDETAK